MDTWGMDLYRTVRTKRTKQNWVLDLAKKQNANQTANLGPPRFKKIPDDWELAIMLQKCLIGTRQAMHIVPGKSNPWSGIKERSASYSPGPVIKICMKTLNLNCRTGWKPARFNIWFCLASLHPFMMLDLVAYFSFIFLSVIIRLSWICNSMKKLWMCLRMILLPL